MKTCRPTHHSQSTFLRNYRPCASRNSMTSGHMKIKLLNIFLFNQWLLIICWKISGKFYTIFVVCTCALTRNVFNEFSEFYKVRQMSMTHTPDNPKNSINFYCKKQFHNFIQHFNFMFGFFRSGFFSIASSRNSIASFRISC